MKNAELNSGLTLDGKYGLIRRLGHSSTATTWLAQKEEGQLVACKILHPLMRTNERAVAMIQREAEVLSRLNHNHIARHIDISTDGALVYHVTEYVDGRYLSDVIGEQTQSGLHFYGSRVRRIFGQLCVAMSYAHTQAVVHRSIRPQNVMVVEQPDGPVVKVLGFGSARLIDENVFEAPTMGADVGEPMYTAPEQFTGGPATIRSDIFALGTILFELVTLRRPWLHDGHGQLLAAFTEPVAPGSNSLASVLPRIVIEPRPRVRNERAALASSLEELISKALAVDPAVRPSSVAELQGLARPGLLAIPDTVVPIRPGDLSIDESSSSVWAPRKTVRPFDEAPTPAAWMTAAGESWSSMDKIELNELETDDGGVFDFNSTLDDRDVPTALLEESEDAVAAIDSRTVDGPALKPDNDLLSVWTEAADGALAIREVCAVGPLDEDVPAAELSTPGAYLLPPMVRLPSTERSPIPVGSGIADIVSPPAESRSSPESSDLGARPTRLLRDIGPQIESEERIDRLSTNARRDLTWFFICLALGAVGVVVGTQLAKEPTIPRGRIIAVEQPPRAEPLEGKDVRIRPQSDKTRKAPIDANTKPTLLPVGEK